MPRFSRKRYKRKPKARRRVDKIQNRRISRLENAVERKFAYRKPADLKVNHTIASGTSQIVALLPASTQDVTTEGRIGNQISLKNFRCDYTISTDDAPSGPMAVRVIFFWLTVPRTWTVTSGSSAPPLSTGVNPQWSQLLNEFSLVPGTTGVPSMNNIVAQRQMLTSSNKSPIIVLSDRVHQIAGFGTYMVDKGIKKLTFSKSYKDMKLTYNDVASSAAPVNRQLYMAVCSGNVSPDADPAWSCNVTYGTTMHYTDA